MASSIFVRGGSEKSQNGIVKSNGRRSFSSAPPKLPPFSYTPPKYTGPNADEVLSVRKEYLNPAIFTYYKKPILLVDGKMQYLFDDSGRRYLDMFAGIVTVSVGHCHPYVTEAAKKQMDKIQHTTTIYLNPAIGEFAKKLASTFPADSDLKVCYFVNSGSEANDLALLMAREYTKNFDIVALRNGYHGAAGSTLGLTALHTWRYQSASPLDIGIRHALNPDTFRGPFKKDDPKAASKYAWDVKNLIEHTTPGSVAGFIAEAIQGVGGAVTYPDGYLQEVYKIVRSHGGVCISDEVQTGFGRTGTHFWGFQTHGVTPDIVTMAKGIGNGAPLAAVVTTPKIAQSLAHKVHFNTYGGNPISSVIGSAVLDVIKNEKIQDNAHNMGQILSKGLHALKEKYPILADVKGKGLMIGVEFVRDRKTLEPAKEETNQIFERMRELGVLVGKGGLYGNILRVKPPMCITKEDCEFFLKNLEIAVSEVQK